MSAAEYIDSVLGKAKKTVARGFVKDRASHSVEDKAGNVVSYDDKKAFYMVPAAAIWDAEQQILHSGSKSKAKTDAVGEALKALARATGGVSLSDFYRTATDIKQVVTLFDKAVEDRWKAIAAEQAEKRREKQLRRDREDASF